MKDINSTRTQAKRLAIIISLVVVMGVVLLIDHFKSAATSDATTNAVTSNTATDTAAPSDATTTSDASGSTASSGYKDGTYTAASQYDVPRSYESIKVTLTVRNGKVVSSSITNSEGDPKSAQFQEDFASSYKSYVTGQNLSDLELSYVAGASDTTRGFNAAVAKIKSQAKA